MRLLFLVTFLMAGIIMTGHDDKNYIIRNVYSVDSVEVLKTGSDFVKVKTLSSVPDPCYKFSHIETEITGKNIQVKVFAKREKDVNCIQIIGRMTAEFKIKIPSPGKYTCTFRGETKSKTMEIETK